MTTPLERAPGGPLGGVLLVARLTWWIWARGMARKVGLSSRGLVLVVASGVAVTGAFGAALAFAVSGLTRGVPAEALQSSSTYTALAATLWLSATFISAVFLMLSPQRDDLSVVLEMLPARRAVVALGGQLPVALIALLVTCAVCGSTLSLVVQVMDGRGALLGLVVALLALLVAQASTTAAYSAVRRLCQRLLRLPAHYATACAGAACLLVSALAVGRDVIPARSAAGEATGASTLRPHRALAATLLDVSQGRAPDAAPVLALLACLAGAALVYAFVSRWPEERTGSDFVPLLTGRTRAGAGPLELVRLEAVQVLRNPQFVIMVVLLMVALVALTALDVPGALSAVVAPAVAGLCFAPFFLGMQSLGTTLPTHWIGRTVPAPDSAWTVPKAIGCFVAPAALSVVLVVVSHLTGLLGQGSMLEVAAQGTAAWGAAMLGGALIPYSVEEPLSGAATAFSVGVLFATTTWLAGRAAAAAGVQSAAAPALTAALVMLVCYLVVSRRSSRADLW